MRRVAITGLGFVTSIGNDCDSVAASLKELRHGLGKFDYLPGCELPVTVAGTIKGFDTSSDHYGEWRWPSRYEISRDTLRSLPPHGVHAICAVEQMLADARLETSDIEDGGTALFTASAGSPSNLRRTVNQFHDTLGKRVAPFGVVSSISGTLNFNLATRYRIHGGVCGFVSACASSAHAMGYAYDEIALGRHKRVIVVAGEDLNGDAIYGFHGMHALSRNPEPATASRPFDALRDGFVGTGGGTALLLEDAEEAEKRGAPLYAEMLGWGQASDGYSLAASDPDGLGLERAMRRAMTASEIRPEEVSYVNAHATSTQAGDRSEIRALHRVFTEAGATPLVSSTKALTGHGLSMAAVMEAGFCALAAARGFIPGQAHLSEPDPECGRLNLPRTSVATAPGIMLKNSSGFGGSNVVLVLRRWQG
jgi:3-oxoacyl-[acyl-carrier-protein] synthase-1